jgi:hypothetical protein
MKKIVASLFALSLLAVLPQCGKKKSCCKIDDNTTVIAQNKRVSGPLAEKEIAWGKEDLQ